MPDVSDDKQMAATYPPKELYEAWVDHADEMDESVSRFMIQMIEAGRKNFQLDDFAATSLRDVRRERDDLRNEVKRLRERIEELERQLDRTSQADMLGFIEENPGATTPEIIQYVADTVPGRVVSQLEVLEGSVLERRDDGYYVTEPDAEVAATDGGDVER